MKSFTFNGMMAPICAPFTETGGLNVAIIPRYAQFLHDNGVKGVFVNGTMGEGLSMTVTERMRLAEAWMDCKDMVSTVIIQIGGCNVIDVKQMATHSESIGVSAIACLPPIYDRPLTMQDLISYCKEIASAAPNTPFLYYHIPMKTNVTFPMDKFLVEAAKVIPTLSGMKFTSMDVSDEGQRALKAVGDSLTILSGFDQTLAEARQLGFPGAINGCFNFMPLESGRLFCLAGLKEGDESNCCVSADQRDSEIKKIQEKINNVIALLTKRGDGYTLSGAKLAVTLLTGIDVGPVRSPNRPVSEAQREALKRDLEAAGFKLATNVTSV